jgi:transcriptional regulator with XRE-family HTH domain
MTFGKDTVKEVVPPPDGDGKGRGFHAAIPTGNDRRAKRPRMLEKRVLAAQRMKLLIEQLRGEYASGLGSGSDEGWQQHVAEQLGMSPSYVSRIYNGERTSIGAVVVEGAIDRLRLDRKWFYDEDLGEELDHNLFIRADLPERPAVAWLPPGVFEAAQDYRTRIHSKPPTAAEARALAAQIMSHPIVQRAEEILQTTPGAEDRLAVALGHELATAIVERPKDREEEG